MMMTNLLENVAIVHLIAKIVTRIIHLAQIAMIDMGHLLEKMEKTLDNALHVLKTVVNVPMMQKFVQDAIQVMVSF